MTSNQKRIASLKHTGLLLLIILGLTLFGFYSQSKSLTAPAEPHKSKLILYLSVIALQYGLLRLIIAGVRRNGFGVGDLIGKNEKSVRSFSFDVIVAVAFCFVSTLILELVKRLLGGVNPPVDGLLPNGFLEDLLWVALSIAAGFVEEVCYRGYPQRQILALIGNAPAAVLLQAYYLPFHTATKVLN